MNWKHFLKLDKRKIVILIVIAIITIISFFLSMRPALLPDILEQDYFGKEVDIFVWSITDKIYLVFGWPIILLGKFGLNLAIDIDLIYWYLLSCLIIWIYDRFRKKK